MVEPQAPADGHTGVESLAASWVAIDALDSKLVKEMQAMTARCERERVAKMGQKTKEG